MAGLEGTTIGGCHLLRYLGGSGAHEVYLAERGEPAQPVAVKLARGEAIERAERAIAGLSHPHILPLLALGEENGHSYRVMPYLPDGSLGDFIARATNPSLPLPTHPAAAASIVSQAAGGLLVAHSYGIFHGNLKPQNVLMDASSSVQAAGVAAPYCLLADFDSRPMQVDGTASASGSPPLYIAPEQCRGATLPASDQYALACIAYLLLTGRTVFTGTVAELYFHHLGTQPLPATQLNPGLPPATDTVLFRALAKDPAQRFDDISAFAAALEAALTPLAQSQHAPWVRAAAPPPAVATPAPLHSSAGTPPAALTPPISMASAGSTEQDGPPAPLPGLRRRFRHARGSHSQPDAPATSTPAPWSALPKAGAAMPQAPAREPDGIPVPLSGAMSPAGRDGPAAPLPTPLRRRARAQGSRRATLAALVAVLLVIVVAGVASGSGVLPFGQVGHAQAGKATATPTDFPTDTPIPTATPTPAFTLWKSTNLQYEMDYPTGWYYNYATETMPDGSPLKIDTFQSAGGQFNVQRSAWFDASSPYNMVGSFGCTGCTFGSFTNTTIDFQTCVRRDYDETLPGGPVQQGFIVSCAYHGHIYVINVSDTKSNFASDNRQYFQPMLTSMRFQA